MAKKKKLKIIANGSISSTLTLTDGGGGTTFVSPTIIVPNPITKLSVDFTSEQLNNLAMKVNEIIDRINPTV